MFTKKPEPGEAVTKLGGERSSNNSESKSSPFTERPATYSKGPSPSSSAEVLTSRTTSSGSLSRAGREGRGQGWNVAG